MKKLNITKEQFEKSRYFNKKYGKLEYVSESGKMFKTNKGQVLKFVKESYDNVMSIEKWIRSKIKSGELPGVEKFKGGRMPLVRFKGSNIRFNYVLQQIGLDSGDKSLWSDETEPFYPPKKLIEKIQDWFVAAPERQRIDVLLDALNKVYDKGGIFGKAVDKKLWLDIPNAFDDGEYIIYGKVEIPKIDVIQNLSEDYPDLDELDENEQEDWLQSHKKAVAEMIEEMAWTYREYAESSKKFGRKFVKESIDADPALVCPYCGGNNCEVSIGTDDLNFTNLDRLQGETFNVECWCNDCNKPYNATVELTVKDVYPNEDADSLKYDI